MPARTCAGRAFPLQRAAHAIANDGFAHDHALGPDTEQVPSARTLQAILEQGFGGFCCLIVHDKGGH